MTAPPSAAGITAYLSADHDRLHALLTTACAGPALDPTAFAAFRAGLLRHIAIEEQVLLPAARRAQGGEPLGRAHDLRIDHAALSSLLVPIPDHALVAELVGLLATHNLKEEGPLGIYAECERLWTAAESASLAQIAATRREVRVSPHHDGPGVHRTVAAALTSARRLTPPSKDRLR